jgi:two-component SAPR family response regulator
MGVTKPRAVSLAQLADREGTPAMSATLVLAVDDDRGILKLTQMSLESAGYSVLAFDNPGEALEELGEGLRPDVIVSDVNMPTLDGFGFYRKVREIQELRGVPFLFLTALDDRDNLRRGMTLGADDYLTKPFAKEELVEAVEVRLRRLSELRRPVEGTVKAKGLGAPVVEQNGERLNWDSLKALELLFYLLEHRGGVSTFEVAEALWPGKTESKASSSFHTTLYRLRKAMDGELIESANRRYYLHPKFKLDYDVDIYRQASRVAKETGKLRDYLRAAKGYGGAFMLGFDSSWIEEVRQNLHAEHLTLLETAAEMAVAEGALETATTLYQRMTEHEPYSESAWDGLAEVWKLRGEKGKASEAKERFEALMTDGDDW